MANDADPSLTLTKMAKGKVTTKLPASKSVPQAQKSARQPKKNFHRQKRPASSDGSDDANSSEADPEGPRARPRKKTRHVDVGGEKNEEVNEEENEGEVEQVADKDDGDAQSEDEQVSL